MPPVREGRFAAMLPTGTESAENMMRTKKSCVSLVVGGALLLLGACGDQGSLGTAAAGENLISNPGFEIGRGSIAGGWRLAEGAQGNTFDWIFDDGTGDSVHAGKRSLRLNAIHAPAPEHSMAAVSSPFRVPPHARVEASVWLKASRIISRGDLDWFGLRVTLTAYDAFGTKVEHRDLMSENGSFDWAKIQGGMIVPAGALTMDLSIKMTTCTGTVWLDEADVRVAEGVPVVDPTGVQRPVLIPRPWQLRLSGEGFELGSVIVECGQEDSRVREAADSLLTSLQVDHAFATAEGMAPRRYATRLTLGDGVNPVLDRERAARFPGSTWEDLGEQGYFLAVVGGPRPRHIYIGANHPMGRFYALQTLRQLTEGRLIYVADVLDKPMVARRGIPVGLQWFERRQDEALQRLTQLKFNFVWVQGSVLNNCLDTDNWRRDFTETQKTILQEFIELYGRNFLDVWIAIGPRGKNPPLQYSSQNDINTVVRKMDALYALGLRNFGLRFDDLANVREDRLLTRADIRVFDDDLGVAQVCFIREVYSRLRALHPDIRFMVIPMDYNQMGNCPDGTGASRRLRQFQKLPVEIGIYAVSYYDEDVLAAVSLTGRPTVAVVSNFYSEGIEDNNEYAVAYLNSITWRDPTVRTKIAAFTWLPKVPEREDAALISWHTAADFAWAPQRYDPGRSFQAAAAKYLEGLASARP